MFLNHLKLTIRNFFSGAGGPHIHIIVLGLAIGFAVNLIIAQYIYFELSFDKQYPDRDRIFYTYASWEFERTVKDFPTHPSVAPFMKRNIPEVESAVRIVPAGLNRGDEWILKRQIEGRPEEYIRLDHMITSDPEIFDFFSIDLIEGDRRTALSDPNSIVITRSVADKFFPDESPMGKELAILIYKFHVTGVIEDPAPNSSLQYKVIFSMNFVISNFEQNLDNNWLWPIFQTFVKLRKDADPKQVQNKVNELAAPKLQDLRRSYNTIQSIFLYPFSDFHFYKPYNSTGVSTVEFSGDKRIVIFFGAIGLLILIISWSNYINLTVARSMQRAKEVGLRKVSGANRKNLLLAFLSEFLLLNAISLLVAFTITQLSFGYFALAIGSRANWMLWREPLFWGVVLLFLISSTVASGIYPAFVMSNYNPVKVLKGTFSRSQTGNKLRKALVLVQFGLSAALLMSIYVISMQLRFMQNKDLGMTTEQILVVRLDDLEGKWNRNAAFDVWKNRIQNRNDVIAMSAVSNYPGDAMPRYQQYSLTTDSKKDAFLEVTTITAEFLNTMDISLHSGRMFREDPSDSIKVIINETAAGNFGFENPEDAVGHQLFFTKDRTTYDIVGVVKNFSTSLKNPAYGSIFHYKKAQHNETTYFLIRCSTTNVASTLAELDKEWKKLFNDAPFDYFFLDDYFDTFYRQERQFAGVFGFFSSVGVVITCMGLFALSVYNAASRTKEIGIRKSLGGSSFGIMWMFSKEYLSLVIAAGVISIPVSALLLNEWLKNYPQRITFGPDFIIVPLVLTVLIAQFTVSYQTFKATSINPVKALRNE